MMTIDSRVFREAGPMRYLAGPVLLNQACWSFDCDWLDVTWPGFESHVGPKIKKFSQLDRPSIGKQFKLPSGAFLFKIYAPGMQMLWST